MELVTALKEIMSNEYDSPYGELIRVFPPIPHKEARGKFREIAGKDIPCPKLLTQKEVDEYRNCQEDYNNDVWNQLYFEEHPCFEDAVAYYLKSAYGMEVNFIPKQELKMLEEHLQLIKRADYDMFRFIQGLVVKFASRIETEQMRKVETQRTVARKRGR